MDEEVIDRAAIYVLAGNLIEIQNLVREYPKIISEFKDGDNLLHLAVDNAQEGITKFLLEEGSDPNSKNGEGESALHMAIFRGYSSLVNLLLQHDANPYIVNSENKSGFEYSKEYFKPEVNSLLQQYFEKDMLFEDLDYSLSLSEESNSLIEPSNINKISSENDIIISFTEPSIIEESTHYSALCSNLKYVPIERLETRNYSSSEEILDFLHELKLRKYFKKLHSEGFDNFEWIFLQMLTPVKIDQKILQMAGLDSKTDRNILIKNLEARASRFELKNNFSGILELLIVTGLEQHYINFSKSNIIDLQQLTKMASEDQAKFDSFLKDSIKISKLGHRLRILGALQSHSLPSKRHCYLL